MGGARSEGVASRVRKTLEYLGLSVLDEASPECAKSVDSVLFHRHLFPHPSLASR